MYFEICYIYRPAEHTTSLNKQTYLYSTDIYRCLFLYCKCAFVNIYLLCKINVTPFIVSVYVPL